MSSFTICASWEINHPFSYCFLLFYYGLSKFSLLWNWCLEVFTKLRGFHLHSAKKQRLTNGGANRSYACWSSWLLLGREEITVSLIVAREGANGRELDTKWITRITRQLEKPLRRNPSGIWIETWFAPKYTILLEGSEEVSRVSLLHALFDRLKERPWKQGNQYFIG